ncbi:MAG: Two component regulator propeller [Bacteroidetes bacterium]|nr:Two component regulator propeller [Bacteroidota bacterium]
MSLGSGAWAQRAIDTWETFLPYTSATQVAQSDDRIYCSTPYSLFYIEKSDQSTYTLTKSTGLSDANPKHIAYHPGKKTLVITYANSNIDLLVNGKDIYNIPDIKNAATGSSKNINDIAIIGEYAYLATDLGISVLDLDKQEIKDNYIIGDTGQSVKVSSICSDGTTIFAATTEGLKSAPLSSPNLQNYANWTVYGPANGLPAGESSLTGQIGSRFYAVFKDTLFVTSGGGSFTKVRYDSSYVYQSFSTSDGYLYAFLWTDYTDKILRIKSDGSIAEVNFAGTQKPLQIIKNGDVNWIADLWHGLMSFNDTTFANAIIPSGPPTSNVFRLAVSNDNVLYMAEGGTDPAYITYNYDRTGPIYYDHKDWHNYNIDAFGIGRSFDLVDVALDNSGKKAYFSSLLGGLVELDMNHNTNPVKYDLTNSDGALQAATITPDVVKITALCLDSYGNLWMANTGSPRALVVKTPDGHWASFFVPDNLQTVRQMVADDYGQIWMGGRGNNMVVYNPGTNILDPSDDQFVSLNTAAGSGGLPNSNVWTIAKDKSGDIWVGTDQGIATFYCAGSTFTTNGCDATLIKVNQGGFIGYLFSTEIVKAIAVDGANRKWIGTTNGVWLISDDGTKQLLHFTSDNSPLPSNGIVSIAVDQYTGEVWIGTDLGLVSYQGDAILGGETKGTALVYPNPVKPNYTGPIAIKGLVDNAYVKITDAAGILVFQGRANGGQMIWDGKGYNGNKVQTGVYLVYADTDLGKEHNVGKIIFIN